MDSVWGKVLGDIGETEGNMRSEVKGRNNRLKSIRNRLHQFLYSPYSLFNQLEY